jgi:hypothetical protein
MRTKHLVASLAAALLVGAVFSAQACGYCIEDRVAAVYDQPAVDRALARRHNVAFLGIEGNAVDADATRAARTALESVKGVDKGSALAKPENAAIAVAYDPAVTSLDALVARANKPLATRGLSLAALRIIDAGGKLREP